MTRLLIFAVLLGFAEAEVTFTHSVLYDEYDIFQPSTTTFINKLCISGCSIYASIPPDSAALKEARNVVIYDGEFETTLFDIAGLYDEATSQKKSYDFPAKQRVVSIHYSGMVEGAGGPVLLYVFSNTGKSNVPFEVYEARTMKRPASPASIITILSPEPFTVGTDATQLGNTVYSYAAGMENALEFGPDHCVKVFELRDQGSFPGFALNVQVPILSFFFNMGTPVQLYTRIEYSRVTGFDQFLSSPGFVGCYGMQVYRSSLYADSLEHTVSGEKIDHWTVDATLNTGQDSPVGVLDVTNNKQYNLWGENGSNNAQQSITVYSKMLLVSWTKMYTRSAFLLRFSSPTSPNVNPSTFSTAMIIPSTTSIAVGNSLGVALFLTPLLFI